MNHQLFHYGTFVLSSGKTADFKIQCEYLDIPSIESLATLVHRRLEPVGGYRLAVGVPTGGSWFAHCLNMRATKGSKRVLIVDDVYTTGGSMRDQRKLFVQSNGQKGEPEFMGIVIFARNPVQEDWITPLFQCSPWAFGVT